MKQSWLFRVWLSTCIACKICFSIFASSYSGTAAHCLPSMRICKSCTGLHCLRSKQSSRVWGAKSPTQSCRRSKKSVCYTSCATDLCYKANLALNADSALSCSVLLFGKQCKQGPVYVFCKMPSLEHPAKIACR